MWLACQAGVGLTGKVLACLACVSRTERNAHCTHRRGTGLGADEVRHENVLAERRVAVHQGCALRVVLVGPVVSSASGLGTGLT